MALTALCVSLEQIAVSIVFTKDIASSMLASVLSAALSVPLMGLLVLLGAPATTYLLETFLLALVLSVLGVQPLIHTHGVSSRAWKKIFSLEPPLSSNVYGLLGMALGAWCGVVPIALDWDRVWQRYPITILMGAYLGRSLGYLLGPHLVYAERN